MDADLLVIAAGDRASRGYGTLLQPLAEPVIDMWVTGYRTTG